MLRATAARGSAGKRTATLWQDDLEALVQEGLMEWGVGAQMRPTAAGVGLVMAAKAAEREVRA